jgi:hypothetical protein
MVNNLSFVCRYNDNSINKGNEVQDKVGVYVRGKKNIIC